MTNNLVFLNTILFMALTLSACGGTSIPFDDEVQLIDPIETPVVIDTSNTNIALNKPATQSSVTAEGVAERAVDGNTSGVWAESSVTHTLTELEPWWQVDLGSIENISNINIYNRTDGCCVDRLSNFYLLVSETPFTSDSLQDSRDQAGVSSYYFGPTVQGSTTFGVDTTGRYVRVQKVGETNQLSLAEVEVISSNNEEPTDPVDNAELADYLAGEAVYIQHCASCHKDLEVSDKRNRSETELRDSMVNIPVMRVIQLTDEEYRVLTFALNNYDPSKEEPEPVEPTEPGNIVSLELGYEAYANNCALCHGNIESSSKRGAEVVSIQHSLENETEMLHLSLNEIEVESIALALADDEGICRADSDPGPVVMRRLSNDEYTNTIRDLLGVTIDQDSLPSDSRAGNFTNAGSSNVNSEHAIAYADIVSNLSEAINDTDNSTIDKYLVCDISDTGVNCARSIIEQFISRAFRRDVDSEELERFVDIYVAARNLDETRSSSLALAIEAVLISPYFNFIVEIDPNPTSIEPRLLNNFELASRLSYFLWASMPDDTLLDLARNGDLSNPDTLNQQVTRMLEDEKSIALIDTFFEQWMTLTDFANPENSEFDYLDPQLRIDMVEETKQLFFKQFVQTDTDMRSLLSTRTTYVNESLANYYGISDISGENFQEAPMAAERAGLLTQASFLVSTSKELESSPVARGKWVLDELLCESPRTPPPDVGEVSTAENPDATLKELLIEHRQNTACAACHETMDPIGLGLENFDQLGHYREVYENGHTVDSLGELPDGQLFNGAAELSAVLQSDTRYTQCVTEKFISYARGALSTARDNCRVKQIAESATQDGFSVPEIINSIVQDISFTTRRTADED